MILGIEFVALTVTSGAKLVYIFIHLHVEVQNLMLANVPSPGSNFD